MPFPRWILHVAAALLLGSSATPGIATAGHEVVFRDGDNELHGTLFVPDGKKPCPGAMVLGGSDRGPRGPLKCKLGRYLARHGVAALVYDSPGTGKSTGNPLRQTWADRAREALAAARFLRTRHEVARERVGLCGGSEGASVALLAAAGDDKIAFTMALSGGFGLTMLEQATRRARIMGAERGLSANAIRKAALFQELQAAVLFGGKDIDKRGVTARIAKLDDDRWLALLSLALQRRTGGPEEHRAAFWNRLRGLWKSWRAPGSRSRCRIPEVSIDSWP